MRLGGRATAVLASGVVAVAAAGCEATADDPGFRAGVIAVVVPGGEDATTAVAQISEAVRNSVKDVQIPGWSLEVVTMDAETVEPSQLIDGDVVAVVGGISDSAVRRLAPDLSDASILFVSPYDDDRVHTRGADPTTSVRPYSTYYTTAVDGTQPLALLAYYATLGLGLESVAAVDAGGAGANERSSFARFVRRNDADVPVSRSAGGAGGEDGVDRAIEQAVDQDVGGLFVSGETGAAASLVNQARSAGLDGPVLLSPALATEDFLAEAGANAEGAVSVHLPTLQIDESASVPGISSPGPFAGTSFDAGTAIGIVLERCLPSASSAHESRVGCAGEMREVAFDGVTGDVAFNDFGERLGSAAEIVVVTDGGWTSLR